MSHLAQFLATRHTKTFASWIDTVLHVDLVAGRFAATKRGAQTGHSRAVSYSGLVFEPNQARGSQQL